SLTSKRGANTTASPLTDGSISAKGSQFIRSRISRSGSHAVGTISRCCCSFLRIRLAIIHLLLLNKPIAAAAEAHSTPPRRRWAVLLRRRHRSAPYVKTGEPEAVRTADGAGAEPAQVVLVSP